MQNIDLIRAELSRCNKLPKREQLSIGSYMFRLKETIEYLLDPEKHIAKYFDPSEAELSREAIIADQEQFINRIVTTKA